MDSLLSKARKCGGVSKGWIGSTAPITSKDLPSAPWNFFSAARSGSRILKINVVVSYEFLSCKLLVDVAKYFAIILRATLIKWSQDIDEIFIRIAKTFPVVNQHEISRVTGHVGIVHP